jgi:hypothetical protein
MANTVQTLPFRGGCVTASEPGLLEFGQYSMIQNMRQNHPGMEKRKGHIKLHTTADGTNKVMSLYQYSKGKKSERHLYAQMSDSDVLEATTAPPGITADVFGGEVFSGTASPVPASWANVDDMLMFCNGVDLPQIYGGAARYVDKFIVYKGTAAIPDRPSEGEDYTNQVTGRSIGNAILDSLGDLSADYDCLFVCCPIVADGITFTIAKPNTTASTLLANYRKNDSTWAALSITDGTAVGGATMGATGTVTFTAPTDSIASHMFGTFGYWYQIYIDTAGDLDSETEVSSVTFESNWQNIVNKWDGVIVPIIEAQWKDNAVYKTFGASSIAIAAFASTDDALFLSSFDDIEAIYVDVGVTPNTTATTTLTLSRWGGAAWSTVTKVDGSNGFANSGWITFARGASVPQEFNKTQYFAHWYKITTDKTMSADVNIALYVQPYYDINEFGKGLTVCAWKGRAVYSTSLDHYLYVSPKSDPQTLNGDNFTILEPGDGRPNKSVAQRQMKSDLIVWQEEKGRDGGCLTRFSGDNPSDISKTIISTTLGTMNAKTVDIVDGVETYLSRDNPIMTLAFCLSKYGVYITDGSTCNIVSGDIGNYFDPSRAECIRRGYENEMWLKWDSKHNVIRIGLVSGSAATVPNVFPVFDIKDKTWSFDVLTQPLSCLEEVEAASGDIPILQIGGGTADGTVYQSNTTNKDVSANINGYATLELDGKGEVIRVGEMVVRIKSGASYGGCTLTPYQDGVTVTPITIE